jgi:hypothetical protein
LLEIRTAAVEKVHRCQPLLLLRLMHALQVPLQVAQHGHGQ